MFGLFGFTCSARTTATPTVEYLVIAGGGGGGSLWGGGGGAGGYLTSTLALVNDTSYTLTIGAGGAAGPAE